ncbi:MAG: coproporphyrinogen dehydrogenase HemZ, partial [Eubacterium sp.]|nr:coproporphyrinogen dehydrogenase HemZ [Eubacterium sp.]
MITVQLNKDDFAYDIHSLVKAFYPSENVSVYTIPKTITEPVLFRIYVDYAPGQVTLAMAEPVPAAQQEAAASRHTHSAMGHTRQAAENRLREMVFPVNDADRKEKKNLLKQHIYQMLSDYSGKTLPWGTLTGVRPVKLALSMLEQGESPQAVADFMKRSYGASWEKIRLSLDIAQRETELLKGLDVERGYSLYIGIPFCPSTCLYCSFTSFPVSMWESRIDTYLDALEREIAYTAERFADRPLNSIYIGGGTPTTLSPCQLNRLLTGLERSFNLTRLLEFTVEAGRPDSITEEKLQVLRAHGISRISINPQTMKQETLDLIGRRHTVSQTVESFHLARSLGFTNINMDLIMGLPQETLADVRHTLDQIKELLPDSVTVHSLAVKRAARLQMFKEDYADLKMINTQEHLDAAAQACAQMGMVPYYLYRQKNMAGNFENVGYALDGKAGIYNILIMEEKQTIVACGAGSVSKRVYPDGRIERSENVKDVAQY